MRGAGDVGWVIDPVIPADAMRSARDAESAVTPSRSRPIISKRPESGEVSANAVAPLAPSRTGLLASGIHRVRPGLSEPIIRAKRGGAIPATRTLRPLMKMD